MASQEVFAVLSTLRTTQKSFITDLTKLNTHPRLQNILLLDKSTAPLIDQIREAFNVLGIKRPHLDRGSDQDLHCLPRCGPREEWTLRWLLKKLEGSQPGPQRYPTDIILISSFS